MDQGIVDFIEQAQAQGISLYDIRSQLLATGWPTEVVDSHLQYVKGGKTEEPVRAVTKEPKEPLRLSCTAILLIELVFLALLFFIGVRGQILDFLAVVVFWAWVVFFGGAMRIQGSFLTGFRPWDEAGVKLYGWGALLIAIVRLVISMVAPK